MKKTLPFSLFFRNVSLSFLCLGMLSTGFGVTYDWTLDNHGSLGVAANWSPSGGPPVAGDTANITLSLTGGRTFSAANISLGIFNIAPSGTPQDVNFGGGSSDYIYMDNTLNNASAQINKGTSNTVSFTRRLYLKSDTVLSVTDGLFQWNGSNASLRDRDYVTNPYRNATPMHLTITGGVTPGQGIALFKNDANNGSFSTLFFGNLTIESNGTLLVNNTFQAQSAKPDDYDLGVVIVKNTGTLSGAGTIERTTTIQSGGTLSAGAALQSTGVLTFTENLTLEEGAQFGFVLSGNSDASRGTLFNGIDLTADLLVEENVVFNLTFNGSGSTVDFTNSFWESGKEWLIFQNTSGTTTADDLFVLGNISKDSNGQDFSITGGSLGFRKDGNDIYLTYAIPEPHSASLLIGWGLASVLLFVARRKFGIRRIN